MGYLAFRTRTVWQVDTDSQYNSKPIVRCRRQWMAIWVFRLFNGYGGGQPQAECHEQIDHKRVADAIRVTEPKRLADNQPEVRSFLTAELFAHNQLRQGWGVPGLNLNQPIARWIENYIISAWECWA